MISEADDLKLIDLGLALLLPRGGTAAVATTYQSSQRVRTHTNPEWNPQ
jgi:hypothetical protein